MLSNGYETNNYDLSDVELRKVDVINTPLRYGTEIYSYTNPKWAKLVFKINGVGNLTLEVSPSLTPGVLPAGVEPGRIPAGTKCFNYDNKILYSITFDDCVNISEMSKSRFDYDDNGHKVNPMSIKPIVLYRNSSKFNKKMTIGYNDGGNNSYLVNFQFESVDTSGITNKFKLPMNLEAFDMLSKLFEYYAQNFFVIQYYNQVAKATDDKLNIIMKKLGIKTRKEEEREW